MELWSLETVKGKRIVCAPESVSRGEELPLAAVYAVLAEEGCLAPKLVRGNWQGVGVPEAVVHLEIGLEPLSCCSQNDCRRRAPRSSATQLGLDPYLSETRPIQLCWGEAFHCSPQGHGPRSNGRFMNSLNISGLLASKKRSGIWHKSITSTSKNVKSKKCAIYGSLVH